MSSETRPRADWDRELAADRLTAQDVADRLWRMAVHEFDDGDAERAAAYDADGFFVSLTAASVAEVDGVKLWICSTDHDPPHVHIKRLESVIAARRCRGRDSSGKMGNMPTFDTLAELREFLNSNVTGMAQDTLSSFADSREKRRADAAEIAAAIGERWSEGLAALDAAIFAMGQNGLMMLKRLDVVDSADPVDSHQTVRIVLALQQFNALIVLQEIQVLLQAGFWSGGAARWRALHEAAVTARVIAEGDAALAQRYLDHGFVVQTRRLAAYFAEHGVGPIGPAELMSRSKEAAALEETHYLADASSKFREPYGWAIPLMAINAKGRRARPSMDSLEKLAGLNHRRLLVASANGMVHGDSGGLGGAILLDDGLWLGGPTDKYIETVARPTLETLIHVVGATHFGFEPELNDFCELICLLGGGLMALCGDGIEKFPRG